MQLPNIYAQNVTKTAIDLTLSVNPLGCSPRVIKALKKLDVRDISLYPDTSALVLRLASRFGVQPENILLGNGSEQLIKLISQTFLNSGDQVRIEEGSFGVFTKEALLAKGNVQFRTLDQIVDASTKLIFIANPKTPTGELVPQKSIRAIQEKTKNGVLVIDEANGELIDETSIPLALSSRNTLILRTFSKTFGLAGIRLGLVIGPKKLIRQLADAQQPFSISQIAVNLGLAALGDDQFIQKTKRFIASERVFLTKKITALGLRVSDSVTNNLFIEVPDTSTLINELNKRDVSVISDAFFPGMKKQGFRISIKDKKTNRLFLKKLTEALARIQNKKTLIP